jgi:hypothetical protein
VPTPTGALSDPRVVRPARRLRAVTRGLQAGLLLVVAGTLAAFGGVHSFAYVPFWCACLGLGALLVERTLTARALRAVLGRRRFSFHPSGLWVVLDEGAAPGRAWWFDLARPLLPPAPLLVPGLLFLALVLLQLAPLPPALAVALNPRLADSIALEPGWRPLSLWPPDTLRGLAFLASMLVVHVSAATLFDRLDARVRFRRFLAGLALALSLLALAQAATGTGLVYGLFAPREAAPEQKTVFGPFINRSHYGGYMLLLTPVALGVLLGALREYARRVGPRANLRRLLVGLSSPEGSALIYAAAAGVASVASFLASLARGALLAFAGALALSGVMARGTRRLALWLAPLALGALVLNWYGTERVAERFEMFRKVAPDRPIVWRDTLSRMQGLWLLGSGFNTFGPAMSRVTAWSLPRGATPWREPYETSIAHSPLAGFTSPPAIGWFTWYPEAHNDYLQVLVENGLPGLFLALLGALAVLRGVRHDPWLLAALLGVLLHCLVDFDLQITAIAVLFVALAAMPTRPASRGRAVDEEDDPEPAAGRG